MAHRSRQRIRVIDCKTDDLTEAAAFWASALGGEATIGPDGRYAMIDGDSDGLVILQAVEHEPRVHLDIESDDKEAEVARLRGLGAREIGKVKTWTVMEAPTGHRFCIVNPQSDDFEEAAKRWDQVG